MEPPAPREPEEAPGAEEDAPTQPQPQPLTPDYLNDFIMGTIAGGHQLPHSEAGGCDKEDIDMTSTKEASHHSTKSSSSASLKSKSKSSKSKSVLSVSPSRSASRRSHRRRRTVREASGSGRNSFLQAGKCSLVSGKNSRELFLTLFRLALQHCLAARTRCILICRKSVWDRNCGEASSGVKGPHEWDALKRVELKFARDAYDLISLLVSVPCAEEFQGKTDRLIAPTLIIISDLEPFMLCKSARRRVRPTITTEMTAMPLTGDGEDDYGYGYYGYGLGGGEGTAGPRVTLESCVERMPRFAGAFHALVQQLSTVECLLGYSFGQDLAKLAIRPILARWSLLPAGGGETITCTDLAKLLC